MKLFKLLFYASLITVFFAGQATAQTNCIEDFENQAPTSLASTAGNWQTQSCTVAFQLDGSTNGTMVLRGRDGSGSSRMFNNVDYSGNLLDQGCELCFDIRYVAGSSNPPTGVNAIYIYQNPLPGGVAARFVVNNPIGSTWQNVCVPIELSDGVNLPSNPQGQWAGVTPADWDNLIQNATGIFFPLDFAGGSNPAENVYVDNLCYDTCTDTCATVVQENLECHADGFTYTFSVENATEDTVVGIIVDGVYDPNVILLPGDIYGPLTINLPLNGDTIYCFDIIMFTDDGECCHVEHCITLECEPLDCPRLEDYELICIGDTDMDGFPEYSFNFSATGAGSMQFSVACGSFVGSSTVNVPPNNHSLIFENDGGCTFFIFTVISYYPDGTICSEEIRELLIPECGDPHDCSCEDLEADVNAAFSDIFDCPKGIYTPNALLPCDEVRWYVNGTYVGNSTGSSPFVYTYPGPGTYEVCMTVLRIDLVNQVECYASICKEIEIREWCEGLVEPSTAIHLSPNPVRDQLMIDLGTGIPSGSVNLRVINGNGQTVIQAEKTAAEILEIDIANLPSGVYFLSVEGNDNYRKNSRFVKVNK